MAGVKINSSDVITVSRRINGLNKDMKNGMNDVASAMNTLDNYWEGAAANATMNKFNNIKNSYSDARYNVVDAFVNFLNEQVGQGYSQTESVNKSLASQFK